MNNNSNTRHKFINNREMEGRERECEYILVSLYDPAAAATSPGTSRPAAPTQAVLAAEPPGNCGFQGGPCPGRKRDWGARRFRRRVRPPPRHPPCCSRSLPWGPGRPWTPARKATSEQSRCWYLKPICAPARHPIHALVWTLSQGTQN